MTALPGSRPDRDRIAGRLWVLSAGLCMSAGGPIIRLADESTAWQFLFYRSLGAGLVLLVYLVVSRRPVPAAIRGTGAAGLVGGLCLAVGFAGFVWGVMTSTVANALFLISASPLFAALLGWLVLRERVSRSMWFAMGGVMAGVAIMVGEGLAEGDLFGDLAALSAALGFAGFSVCIRRGRHTDMSPTILIAAAVTAAVSGALALAGGTGLAVPLADIGLAAAYGVLVIGAGIFMLTVGARHVPAAELVVLSLTEVVFGTIWVALAFGEVPSLLTLARRHRPAGQHRRPGRGRDAALD